MRKSLISRKTTETDIRMELILDGNGVCHIDTGIGYFNHMLQLMARHGAMNMDCSCRGDIEVDGHHTVEDIGICLGKALHECMGDKRSIKRYGTCFIPMDEALAMVSIDISGRPYLHFDANFNASMVGSFDTELVEEFFRAMAVQSGITMHIRVLYGKNTHHMIEAIFKAFGRSLHEALSINPNEKGIPSTKGMLE